MTISFHEISGSYAKEVRGADLWRNLSDGEIADIRGEWREAGVLVFRRQCVSEDELEYFSARFGEPEIHPRTEWNSRHNPRIVLITNLRTFEGGELGALGSGELDWHTDQSYVCRPATGAIFHGVEVPPSGTPTYFANLRRAYADLDPETKDRIEDCEVIFDYVRRTSGYVGDQPEIAELRLRFPRVTHPLVNADPITGEKALYLDPATMAGIVNWPEDAARTLFDRLIEHATQEKYVYRHEWKTGDIVMWDNGQMLHRRDPVGSDARLMKRTTIQLPAEHHIVPSGTFFDQPAT